jgi:phosphomevalonate kinase
VIDPCQITILADDSYYTTPSTKNTSFPREPLSNGQFTFFGVPLWDAHKTGLGSSAALVTALSAALLAHYVPDGKALVVTAQGRERVHRLAQAAHCAAQGKIGSGFDVASAVYGSCVYRRFSPALLERLGAPGSVRFSKRLKELVDGEEDQNEGAEDTWDAHVSKQGVKLPPGLRLAMCDVDCGSQTPGMVKKVLAWRAKEPDEAGMLWKRLDQANRGVAAELENLASGPANDQSIKGSEKYDRLVKAIRLVREMIRDMSRLSDVPIEPNEQTQLLDVCSQVEGIIGGVVPGAGGYDAIALLMEDSHEAVQRLQECLEKWNSKSLGNEKSTAGRVSLLKVREDDEGIRIEDPTRYETWLMRREDSRSENDAEEH